MWRPAKITVKLLWVTGSAFAVAMVAFGAALPGYAELPLLVFWFPVQTLTLALLIPFLLEFVGRRFSVFAAATLATPSLMLLPDDGFLALIVGGGLFLVGLAGIILALFARLGHEVLRG